MRKRRTSSSPQLFLLFLILFFISSENGGIGIVKFQHAEGKKRVQVPDELDDVVDKEEDEAWKEWGKKKGSEPKEFDPPPDFSGMNPSEIQAEMMKRHFGPTFGFVKLRLGVRRSSEAVSEIAMKWTKVLRTGAVEARFMAVDVNTIMFTMEKGQDTKELKGFILDQPEAYEVKIGDMVFRRPGDPPLEQVVETLHKRKTEKADPVQPKDEF